jgi:hypothetical protein
MKMFACLMSSRRIVGAILALLGVMLLGAAQGLQAQECDLSLYDYIDSTQDSVFYYGLGESTSRSRPLARRMAMAQARGALVLSARADVRAFEREAQSSVGEQFVAISNDFAGHSVAFVEAQITNVITEDSTFCPEGGLWTFIMILKMDQGNLAAEVVEQVQQAMENSIENGDAQYSRTQTDRIFSEVDNLLEERRRRRGGQEG